MKILIAFGSKHGGTAELAERLGVRLVASGFAVDVLPASAVSDVQPYDAVLLGGGLYAGRWVAEASRFVLEHVKALRQRPVWFFSSGPLDGSAARGKLDPTPQVARLLAHVGGRGHVTFGGRLAPDTRGFIASKLARTKAGDWRDLDQLDAWADQVAADLTAQPVHAAQQASAFARLPSRTALALLCLAVGLSAVGGGVSLAASPDGSLLQLPLSVLTHSPFQDFFVPGLLLILVVGLGNTASAALHLLRRDSAPFASLASGFTLLVWMAAEVVILRQVEPIQAALVLFALLIVALSIRDLMGMFPVQYAAGRPAAR
jgi:menaquinone-dependent protoporphyrinogen oxidase